ncbi:MAG: peptidoglycan editing factor PgeF [Xanthomonadaceae bacterium]|nr:peptidoglycan editing factor PgeF [Xanthomonadaceae bacterium]
MSQAKLITGFGTLTDPIPAPFKTIWDALKPTWKQTHGVNVVRVDSQNQNCGDTDGLVTTQLGIPIGVVTADCVPILIGSETRQFIGAFHAGWKGTKARILSSWIQSTLTREYKIQPQELKAWIGPAIGPCCYEVGEDLFYDFQSTFSELPKKIITPTHRHLDLQKIHALELEKLGFSAVEIIRECTKCTLNNESKNWKYASYRRDGTGVRQYTLIQLQNQ